MGERHAGGFSGFRYGPKHGRVISRGSCDPGRPCSIAGNASKGHAGSRFFAKACVRGVRCSCSGTHAGDGDRKDQRRREKDRTVDDEKTRTRAVRAFLETTDRSEVADATDDESDESEEDERQAQPGKMGVVRGVRVKKKREAAEEEVKLFDDEPEGDETDARADPGEKRPFGGKIDPGIGGIGHKGTGSREGLKDSRDRAFAAVTTGQTLALHGRWRRPMRL